MLSIKQWQKDNHQLLNRVRGQKSNLDLIYNLLVEDVCDGLEEVTPDNRFLAHELLDTLGPRLHTLMQIAGMFEDLSASYDEQGNQIR